MTPTSKFLISISSSAILLFSATYTFLSALSLSIISFIFPYSYTIFSISRSFIYTLLRISVRISFFP